MPPRVAVLTYESPQANLITSRVLARYPGQVAGIVRSDAIVAGKGRARSGWFLLRHTGLGFVGRKAFELALSRAAWSWCRVTGRAPAVPSLPDLARRAGVPLVGAEDVNAPAVLARVAGWRPDLLVSVNLNQRIGTALRAVAPDGALNVHGALLPRHRGLFPYFWSLVEGDAEGGVTVHWIDAHFDTGDVVLQRAYPILPDDTVASLAWIGAELGADLLLHALVQVAGDTPPHRPQDERAASYRSWPTRADVRRLRSRGRRYGPALEGWHAVLGTSGHEHRLAAVPACALCRSTVSA
jgi:folate-dependent phosphoribosylglycinamide formyltransferase PurN